MAVALLTPDEVGGWLNVKPRTVLRYAREGKLRCTRLDSKNVRFTNEQVEDFISARSSVSQTKPVDNPRMRRLPCPSQGGDKVRRGLQSLDFSPTDRQEMKKWR